MNRFCQIAKFCLAITLFALAGCAGIAKHASNGEEHSTTKVIAGSDSDIQPVVYLADEKTAAVKEAQKQTANKPAELTQPETVSEKRSEPSPSDLQRLPPTDGLTLDSLQGLALGNHPAVSQAEARICALYGKWQQVGLPPNPTAGYLGSEIGNEGAAGQQGAYVGQDFITGGKLERNRCVVLAEIHRARQELAVVQQRVRTDVSKSFYDALLAQRRVELAEQLVKVTESAVQASQALYKAEEIPLAGLLQAELQLQNAQVLLRTSQNRQSQAWRQLRNTMANTLGTDSLFQQPLAGDVSQLPNLLDWDAQLARLQSESPEVAAAMAEVSRARRALDRACVEAVPDVSTQVSLQYDDATADTVAGVQIGMPLPLWNRNQGGIRQAQAEITAAVRNVDRVEKNLAQRLANAFRQYADAQVTAETYAAEILPRSKKTFELVREGYEEGEVGYLDSLIAQQTYSQTNLAYLDALGQLWQSYVRIDGLLLENSFGELP